MRWADGEPTESASISRQLGLAATHPDWSPVALVRGKADERSSEDCSTSSQSGGATIPGASREAIGCEPGRSEGPCILARSSRLRLSSRRSPAAYRPVSLRYARGQVSGQRDAA